MKLVIALGGNALLRRDQAPSAENQLENIRTAASQLARVAAGHALVVTHGNGVDFLLMSVPFKGHVAGREIPEVNGIGHTRAGEEAAGRIDRDTIDAVIEDVLFLLRLQIPDDDCTIAFAALTNCEQ